MAIARARMLIRISGLDRRIRRAQRRERDALTRAGEHLASSAAPSSDSGASRLRDEILEIRRVVDALSEAIARSLDDDRADYITVSRRIRPLVVARGLCDRMVLRHQRAQRARGLSSLYAQLGVVAMAGSSAREASHGVPGAIAHVVRSARAEAEAAAAERARCLAPFQGSAWPAWIRGMAAECGALGKAVLKQLRSHFVPRTSALAGLAAGWWVANTFTDSPWRSVLRSFGIGRGGTHVVSAETFQAMRFWLPILAAGICAYLGDRLAHAFRLRYEGHRGTPEAQQFPSSRRFPVSS